MQLPHSFNVKLFSSELLVSNFAHYKSILVSHTNRSADRHTIIADFTLGSDFNVYIETWE